MKWNRTLSAAVVAAFALGASACGDGLADLNDNPNAPRDVPAQVILPEALQSTIELVYGGGFNLTFTGLFAQHWGKIQYTEEDLYILRPENIDTYWNVMYAASLRDWQAIIEKGQEAPAAPNHEATGRVMKAFLGHIMTDIWGDIPWSEALQADAESAIMAPSYDSQQDIYDALIAELDAALALFDAGEARFSSEDLIYQGDVAAWARFANSLKLRLAMRISDVEPTTAANLVAQVLASPAGLIDANSENAMLAFLDAAPNQNPLYENRWVAGRDDHAVSATLVDYMSALDDPRLAVYAEPASSDGAFRGVVNGTHSDDVGALGQYSRIGDYWRGSNKANATRPALLMTAAEVQFLLAEAALELGVATPQSAQQHYQQGVTLALQMYDGADGVEISPLDITTYLAQPGVAWGTGDSNLELIIEQKWLALYTNGPEAYAEYRRTGYPDEIAAGPSADYDFVPGRIPYPPLEQSLNRESWEAANAAQGINGTYLGGVWWDTDWPS